MHQKRDRHRHFGRLIRELRVWSDSSICAPRGATRTTITKEMNVSLSCDLTALQKSNSARFLEMVPAGSRKIHQESFRCFGCRNWSRGQASESSSSKVRNVYAS